MAESHFLKHSFLSTKEQASGLRYNVYRHHPIRYGARKIRAMQQWYRRPLACSTISPTVEKSMQMILKEVPFGA